MIESYSLTQNYLSLKHTEVICLVLPFLAVEVPGLGLLPHLLVHLAASSYSLAFPWLMVVEGSDLAHPQDAVGFQSCQLVELAQTWLCLHWGSHLVLAAPTPAIFG